MSKLKVMYNGHPFSPATNLTSSIGPTDSIIAVNDISVFPPAPNVATINDGDGTGETIIYTAKTSNALSGCSRGVQGKAKSHSMGADIARYFTAYDYDALRENINSLNGDKVEKEVGKVLSDNNYTTAEKQEVATIKDKVDTTTFESFKASNTKAINAKADAQAVNDALAGKTDKTTFESFQASNTQALNKKADAQTVNDALAEKASNTALTNHVNNKNNPHGITPAQIGALSTTGKAANSALLNGKEESKLVVADAVKWNGKNVYAGLESGRGTDPNTIYFCW